MSGCEWSAGIDVCRDKPASQAAAVIHSQFQSNFCHHPKCDGAWVCIIFSFNDNPSNSSTACWYCRL